MRLIDFVTIECENAISLGDQDLNDFSRTPAINEAITVTMSLPTKRIVFVYRSSGTNKNAHTCDITFEIVCLFFTAIRIVV